MAYTFKDFATGKLRCTHGEFIGWTKPTGLLVVPYAIFKTPRTRLLVPRYPLTAATLATLPPTDEVQP